MLMAPHSKPAVRDATVFWGLLLWCLLAGLAHTAPEYTPRIWNSSCNYTVTGIPASMFFTRTKQTPNDPSLNEEDDSILFPLSPAYRLTADMAVKACFGPGEQLNHTLVAAGVKMPCGYSVKHGIVSYWEENACRETITSNCYCYAINKIGWSGGYCMPGYRNVGDDVDFASCSDTVHKVELDGAVRVSKQRVDSAEPPPGQHYIAMVIWAEGKDYHFFRRDASGIWSQKKGDTFVTNTYLNGSSVTDVEDPSILGAYKEVCGYFLVNPASHAVTATYYAYQQSFVHRLAVLEKQPGMTLNMTRLPHPSRGWAKSAYKYYLMGLDTAVFESKDRPLPWQGSDASPSQPPLEPQQQQQQQQQPGTAAKSTSHAPAARAAKRRAAAAAHQAAQQQHIPRSWSLDKHPAFSMGPGHSSSRMAGVVQPHWMSHMQPAVPVGLRDQAVRAHWHGAFVHARQAPPTRGMPHSVSRTA